MEKFQKLFDDFRSIKVGVIGDVMLDTYMWGIVERISPEAPVPVVTLQKREQRVGGAGNVALNLQSLGAKAFVLSVMGADGDGAELEKLLLEQNIDSRYSFKSSQRITTNKTRVISRNQHMLRLDAEIIDDLHSEDEAQLIDSVKKFVAEEKPQIIIFEDYNKGVLTESVISAVISICKQGGVLTAVDPKRKNFFAYKGIDIFKPNLKEVKDGLNLLFNDIDKPLLQTIHSDLENILHHHISFITLSEKGVFFQHQDVADLIPSHLRNIADVSGAGDTVIAVASLVYAATGDVTLMAEVANIAGGLVCEEVGTAAINREKLLHECELLLV
ncbi:MAG: bifunctional ADP-heptose synthase [Chitinophagaceae bacterium]